MPAARTALRRSLPIALVIGLAPAVGPVVATAATDGPSARLTVGGAAYDRIKAQRVTLRADGGATVRSRTVQLPVGRVDAGRLDTTVRHRGRLTFVAGRRKVRFGDVRLVVGEQAQLRGKRGRRTVVLGTIALSKAQRQLIAGGTAVAINDAAVALTPAATRVLRTALARPRLRSGRFGRLTVSVIGQGATVVPVAPSGAAGGTTGSVRKLLGGSAAWGVSAGLREMFPVGLVNDKHPDQPMRTLLDGATQAADDGFGLGVVGGVYAPASGAMQVALRGGIRFGYYVGGWAAYPPADGIAHGIWASFSQLTATFDGTTGRLEGLTDAGFHSRAWIRPERRVFADLDLRTVTPQVDAAAGTVTWRDVPVRLNAVGAPLGLGYFPAGTALDPLTIVARLGD